MESVLVLTGSMGTGKTTTMAEASDLLTARNVRHAAVDLDALAVAHTGADHDLMLRNLASVCANFEASGITRLLIAAAVESRDELARLQCATNARTVVVCRLRAPMAIMEDRVAARERGIFATRYIERVRVLEAILDAAGVEDFSVMTDVPVTLVATDVLRRSRWIDSLG